LHESQKLAAAIGALLLGHQSGTSQPTGWLLLQAWISCARSVAMRTEDRVIPDLLCGARRASHAWHRGTWVARQAGRRRHAPCGQRCLCSYRGRPHWLARRHVWLQADLGEAV